MLGGDGGTTGRRGGGSLRKLRGTGEHLFGGQLWSDLTGPRCPLAGYVL